MDIMNFIESIFRWLHVIFGILWIGLLYFFNFVNSGFAPTMDAETKKKVVPELMPRTLFWFRWGAAFTWITGVLLLMLVYYHGGLLFGETGHWGLMTFIMLAITFLGTFVYDVLAKGPLKDLRAAFIGGLVVSFLFLALMDWVAGFSFRGYAIHLGAFFGTMMAFNVWFRIWPAQRQIITATKNGDAPDAALVAIAGLRSRHNTYMSVPLVFLMINQHATWAASPSMGPILLTIVVLVGWGLVYHLYDRAAQVKGF